MTAMQEMMAYLRRSPSLVYPADVLEYAVRAEEDDARMRQALRTLYVVIGSGGSNKLQRKWLEDRCADLGFESPLEVMRDLGIMED